MRLSRTNHQGGYRVAAGHFLNQTTYGSEDPVSKQGLGNQSNSKKGKLTHTETQTCLLASMS